MCTVNISLLEFTTMIMLWNINVLLAPQSFIDHKNINMSNILPGYE